MNRPLRAVLFDLYGTLLAYGDMRNAWHAWGGLLAQRLAQHGGRVDPDAWPRLLLDVFEGSEPEPAAQDDLTVHERRLLALADQVGAHMGPEDARAMADDGLDLWQRNIDLAPDVYATLGALREHGLATGLVTNFDHPPHVHNLLRQHKLEPLLDVVVVSGAVGLKKPDPAIMHLALEPLGVAPAEAAFVGDSPEDMQAARAAGMACIGITHEGDLSRLEGEPVHALVTTLGQVVDWVAARKRSSG